MLPGTKVASFLKSCIIGGRRTARSHPPFGLCHWGSALLSLTLALCACASGPKPHDSPEGFVRVKSAHFVLHTDADEGDYQHAITALENTHAALKQTFFPVTKVNLMHVVLLKDEDYFHDLVGENVGGVFITHENENFIVAPATDFSPTSMLEGEAKSWLEILVTHELAHRFIHGSHPEAPSWFHEGFATFLETVTIREGTASFGVGQAHLQQVLAQGQVLPLPELLDEPWQGAHGSWQTSDYASAWAFFHFLTMGLGPRHLNQLRLAMHQGGPDQQWSHTVSGALSGKPIEELDKLLRDYISERLVSRARIMRLLTVPFNPPEKIEMRVAAGDTKLVRKVCRALKEKPFTQASRLR